MSFGPTDLQFAWRSISRRPALAAAVVLPIAFAIAVNSALFSVMDGLLFRPLPFDRPDELVAIDYRRSGDRVPDLAFQPYLEGERQRIRLALEASPLLVATTQAGFSRDLWTDAPEFGIQPTAVDSRFFPLLGLTPLIGSQFSVEDELLTSTAGAKTPIPVILGHRLWHRAFGGDPHILGVRDLAGHPVRIVGVMGPGVKFPGETNLWVATRTIRNRPPAYARLAPRATTEQLAARFPELQFTRLEDVVRPDGAHTLLVLFGAACLLLLVAWVQVAALIFAGIVGRVHELGVRLALGAGRLRVLREVALENALLAGAAVVIAWLAAAPITAFVISTLPAELSRGQYLDTDLRTFAFACAVSLFGFLILTVLPVAVIRRASPTRLLQGHFGRLPFRAERVRHALLLAQITLTTTLLYLSGLMVHSFVRAATYDFGFDSKHVLLFTPPLPPLAAAADLTESRSTHPDYDARFEDKQQKTHASLDALRHVKSVIAAASFADIPLVTRGSRQGTTEAGSSQGYWSEVAAFGGRQIVPAMRVRANIVSPDFIAALGATMIVGRSFDSPEHMTATDAVVINETMARQLAPAMIENTIPVGILNSTIYIENERSHFRIIGVIKDLVYSTPAEPAVPQIFQLSRRLLGHVVAIRTHGPVEDALPEIRSALQRVWGEDLPAWHFSLLRDAWHEGLVPFRGKALLVSLVGGFCVPLAALGVMGALLYSVRVRTRETAIRIALGADPDHVRRSVVLRALMVVAVGVVLGSSLGVAAGRAASNQLFSVQPADPWTIAAVATGLLMLAWLAALLPAAQASRIEPATALRHE